MVKGAVCKTAIRRFKSACRLQFNSFAVIDRDRQAKFRALSKALLSMNHINVICILKVLREILRLES